MHLKIGVIYDVLVVFCRQELYLWGAGGITIDSAKKFGQAAFANSSMFNSKPYVVVTNLAQSRVQLSGDAVTLGGFGVTNSSPPFSSDQL